ncbi:MAG: hypothetical protein KatS3mg083_262 [Candidatus Dojkabacteria bacterium]|nr:MAG: hypothetical protein KatS3mg083_262 [Candidatus Dojkabacteria bacterium]
MAFCSLNSKEHIKRKLKEYGLKMPANIIDEASERVMVAEEINNYHGDNRHSYEVINQAIDDVFTNAIESLKRLKNSPTLTANERARIDRDITRFMVLREKYARHKLFLNDGIKIADMVYKFKELLREFEKARKSFNGYNRVVSTNVATMLSAMNLMQQQLADMAYMLSEKEYGELNEELADMIKVYKRELIKNVLATNGSFAVTEDGTMYVLDENNMYITLDRAVDRIMNALKNKDISVLSQLTTSLGQTFEGGTEAAFEGIIRDMLNKAEAEAMTSVAQIYEDIQYVLNAVKDRGKWNYVIDSNRRIRTLYTEYFTLYRDSIIDSYLSEGRLKYDELIKDRSNHKMMVITSRQAVSLFYNEEYKALVREMRERIYSVLEDYDIGDKEKIKDAINKAIETKLLQGFDEEANNIEQTFSEAYTIAIKEEARQVLRKAQSEYGDQAFVIATKLEEIMESLKEGETLNEEAVQEIIDYIEQTFDKLTLANRNLNGDFVLRNDFILLPDEELVKNTDLKDLFIDKFFINGVNEIGGEYYEVMGRMYNIMQQLREVLPASHANALSDGDLLFLSNEMIDKSQGFTGRLLSGIGYATEAASYGLDLKSKYLSARDISLASNEEVNTKVNSLVINAVAKIYDVANNLNLTEEEQSLIENLKKNTTTNGLVNALNKLRPATVKKLVEAGALDSISHMMFSEGEIKLVQEYGRLGNLILSKAKNVVYSESTNQYETLMTYYALLAAKYYSPLVNINEINAILMNFIGGEKHKEKIKKIISVSYFGGDKEYNESKVGRALNLYLSEKKLDDVPLKTPRKNIQEITRLLEDFTNSEYFREIKDTEEGQKFLEALKDLQRKKHMKWLTVASAMNDIMRIIALAGNAKSVLMNIMHGVTSNFVMAYKYDIDENDMMEIMDIMEKGAVASVTNPNSEYAKKYKKIRAFIHNYGIIGSFVDKSTLAAAQDMVNELKRRGEEGLIKKIGGLKEPMWMYSRSEEYIQGSLAMAMLMKEVEFYEERDGVLHKITLLEALDNNGNIRKELLDHPKNKAAIAKLSSGIAKVKKVLTEAHGQYGLSNYTLLDGTTLGKVMLNFKKWMMSYYYERFGGERYEIDRFNGVVKITKKEGRLRSLDLASGGAASFLLHMTGANMFLSAVPLAMSIVNVFRGNEPINANVFALFAGALSSFAAPIDLGLKLFGIKSNLSGFIRDVIVGATIGKDQTYKTKNVAAVGKELGFIMMMYLAKQILYALFQSLLSKDSDDEMKKYLLRIMHTFSSVYIKDLQTAYSPFSYAKSLITEPSIKWNLEALYRAFAVDNFTYKNGMWAGYTYREKKLSSFLPKSLKTLYNPRVAFGFGVDYNYAALPIDLENDAYTKFKTEYYKKTFGKSSYEYVSDILKEIAGIEPSIR